MWKNNKGLVYIGYCKLKSIRGDMVKYIIPVLVGAVIGYITNWVAIKMLFRPHEEKRILGFHIPFTPGLIPKERNRIARNLGEVVGGHLLSPQVIKNWLYSNNLEVHLRRWVESSIDSLKGDERSLRAIITKDCDEIVNRIKEKITELICIEIKKNSFKEAVVKFIREHFLTESMDSLSEIIDEELERYLFEIVTSPGIESLLRASMNHGLSKLTKDERSLKDVIPDNLIHAIKAYIKDQEERIVSTLKTTLNDPGVEIKIRKSIASLASQQMNRLVSFFISPEAISNTVYAKFKEYMDKPDFKQNIIHVLIGIIDRLMENKVRIVAEEVMSTLGEEEVEKITSRIIGIISNRDNLRKLVDVIGASVRAQKNEVESSLLRIISRAIERTLKSQDLYSRVNNIVDRMVESIINRPISSIAIYMNESFVNKIIDLSMDFLNRFIENKLPKLLEFFNISKVVEEEINRYDVAFTEELILQIAHRELKAITWLGGLLGGIIGLLTPLLQMIS